MRATEVFRRYLPRALVVSYACAIVSWNLLLRTPASSWWPIQLVGVFNVWLYLPLIPLGAGILLARDLRSGSWLLLPLLLFAWQYGQLFVPSPRTSEGIPLRVMTANLQFENRDASEVAALIVRLHPDVVGLQELGAGMSASLAESVRSEYPYQALYPEKSTRGMGVLSRYPIVDSRPPEMADGECNCQQVTLDVRGQQMTVFNVHPNPPNINVRREGPVIFPAGFSTRQQENVMLALRHKASAVTTPLLIFGDMNMTDTERPYSILAQTYRDSYREAGHGFGFTFPSRRGDVAWPFPVVRIDYVFHDDTWAAESAQVEDLPGSDHHGIFAELVLRTRFVQRGPGGWLRPYPLHGRRQSRSQGSDTAPLRTRHLSAFWQDEAPLGSV